MKKSYFDACGPILSEKISKKALGKVVYSKNSVFDIDIAQLPKFVIGRKGSGKTLVLKLIETHVRDYVIRISADEFLEIYTEKVLRNSGKIIDCAKLCFEVIYESILQALDSDYFQSYKKSENIMSHQQKIRSLLDGILRHNKKIILIIETSDSYDWYFEYKIYIDGLLNAIANFPNDETRQLIRIVFCLPLEIYDFCLSNCNSAVRVFEKKLNIEWSLEGLLDVVAKRIEFYYISKLKKSPVKNIQECRNSFNYIKQFFQDKLTKENDGNEDPLIYILRYTQLLPRHLILCFNNIMKDIVDIENDRITAKTILQNVRSNSSLFVVESINSNKVLYRSFLADVNIDSILKNTIPYLKETFDYNEFSSLLQKDFPNTNLCILIDFLSKISCMGNVLGTDDRYTIGDFQYDNTIKEYKGNRRFCFHPIYSLRYGAQDHNILPFNSDFMKDLSK